MVKVDNQKVIFQIAKTTYKANKKRNILTIIAIVLTTFLIISILGIGIGYWNMLSDRSVKMEGMDYDIELTEPTEKQVEAAGNMEQVKYAGVNVKCAIIESAYEKKVAKTQLFWADQTCWRDQCLPAFASIEGAYPQKKRDLLLSESALKDMGITDPQPGMKIPVTYYPLNERKNLIDPLSYEFRLCGFFKDYTGRARGFVSQEFYQDTGAKQTDFTQGSLKITLNNSLYSQKTILNMQEALELENKQMLIADDRMLTDFIKTMAVLLLLLLMIFASGYLFIYNTLYICVAKDIRYYGQLKTVGMTSVQLKKIIYLQAVWNSGFGIPIGLLAGLLTSVKVIPAVLAMVSPELSSIAEFEVQPLLFVLAALFSLFTVFAGCRKPALIAGDCSPIEAARYVGMPAKGKARKSVNGLRVMAWRNMFRDKKQAVIILASFVISLVIFLTILVVIQENNAKRILDEIMSFDLKILNEAALEERQPILTQDKIDEVSGVEGVSQVRKVYSDTISIPYQEEVLGEFYKDLYQSRYSPGNYKEDISGYKQGQALQMNLFKTRIVAIDEAGFDALNKSTKNTLDREQFEAGKIGVLCPFIGINPKDAVGKKMTFSLENGKEAHTIQIAGVGENPAYFAGGYTPELIVSEKFLKTISKKPIVELIDVDYSQSYDKTTERSIKEIFQNSDSLSYESKLDRYDQMLDTEKQIKVLGTGIGLILALLAVLNFVNMMAAGVQNRRQELAALESIGMTSKQIKKTLSAEGLGYGVISIIGALILGVPVSYMVFQSMNLYNMSFSMPILANAGLFLVILLICMIVPPWIYRVSEKESILERLREEGE
ncbi:ABC transporter permease [Hominibacterium faecale]|uniref:ABC transporter permease n=1 Tax=Hominibacterium faecale TaxID=2839743 RepID=UPI0022B2A684|nr:ABC transporter permease [Hominibacterium faecale]